jgi:hypothetical protein
VELHGHLGSDRWVISKDGKSFVVLNIADTDSYPVGQGEDTQ